MVTCSSCGAEIIASLRRCPNCRTPRDNSAASSHISEEEIRYMRNANNLGLPVSQDLMRRYQEHVASDSGRQDPPVEQSRETEKLWDREEAKGHMIRGALWMLGGGAVSLATFTASESGVFYLFWGAILWGAVDFIRGLVGWSGD